MEKLHLHFALHAFESEREFFIQGHGKKEKLFAYKDHPKKFEEHRKLNAALALIPQSSRNLITHFAEEIELPDDMVSRLSIISPAKDPTDILPDLISVHFHVPTPPRKRFLQSANYSAKQQPLVLKHLGVEPSMLTASNHQEVKLGAALLVSVPLSVARSIVFHHPEIGTVDIADSAIIFERYMEDHNDFDQLVNYISSNPYSSTAQNPWYKKTHSIKVDPVTLKESIMPPTTDKFADGKSMDWPKDPATGEPVIPLYQLSDETSGSADGGVIAAASVAVKAVLKATKNDKAFNGSLWSRSSASVSLKKSNVDPLSGKNPLPKAVKDYWSVKYDSDKQYGLDLYGEDIKFSNNTLSFPVKNWPSRGLGVYIEYQTVDGTPIPWSVLKNTKEGSNLVKPEGFVSSVFSTIYAKQSDTTTKIFWGILGSGNTCFGIPFPTNPLDINFQWPHDQSGAAIASRAEVYIGGLGVANGLTDWDSDVDMAGLISTGILNYGITAACMAFTVAVVGPLKKQLMASEVRYAVLAFAIPMGVTATVVSSLFWENANARAVLSKISNFVAGFIFGSITNLILEAVYKEAIKKLIGAAIGTMTTQQALEQIPYAGWALKIASVAADIASLAATTIECLASPATYKLQVQQSMDLTVTVKPDPSHGTQHQNPIWPLVADHWVMMLKYPKNGKFEGGTTYIMAGPMPGKKDDPIVVTFNKVPAGGQIQIVANIYSDADWIAGQWDSGLKSATPDADGKLQYKGAITENLVPLTSSTKYREKQRVGFGKDQKHMWIVTSFTIDSTYKSDLDAGRLSKSCRTAFADNGVELPEDDFISVKTEVKEKSWDVTDKKSGTSYHCQYKPVYSGDGKTYYTISVYNSTRPSPKLPFPKFECSTIGDNHNLCDLVGMTINNKAYQLGYAWRATGMNLPKDLSTNPVENGLMYTMQSISTLAQPSDLIIQSKVGFSQMPFIAYDQFGLTPLFFMDFQSNNSVLNNADNKPVPAAILKSFTDRGFEIPQNTTVKLVKTDMEWRLLDVSKNVLFDLIVETKVVNGAWQKVINIFNYVVPGVTNFYMDPRPGPDGNYHMRAVSFNDGLPGSYNFDVDFDSTKANSWGTFPIRAGSTLFKLAIHPAGFAVAIDYGLDKLWTLKIPDTPSKMSEARVAMPLSGSGELDGLLRQPKAMTISSDGRIIILEQGNKRMQSFDINGNAVASFKGSLKTKFPSTLIGDLNNKTFSTALLETYQQNIPAKYLRKAIITKYDEAAIADLNNKKAGKVLRGYFKAQLIELPESDSDVSISVTTAGSAWLLTNKTEGLTYEIRWNENEYTFAVHYAPNLQIDVVAKGMEWKISDRVNSLTFNVTAGKKAGDPLDVQQLISTAGLRDHGTKNIEYLDIATEDKGYIYVLYFEDPGTSANQYMLDIYNPDGTILLGNPLTGLAAAKMAVDQWRTLWTLNYETFRGPSNRTEPSVSGWIPSTPDAPTKGNEKMES
ncbi:MAG TPA: hypothetical protein VFG10_16145 [Saprospiraceae bacterium]|nr:hypothetical protein [Saprospiraceae bacterium]